MFASLIAVLLSCMILMRYWLFYFSLVQGHNCIAFFEQVFVICTPRERKKKNDFSFFLRCRQVPKTRHPKGLSPKASPEQAIYRSWRRVTDLLVKPRLTILIFFPARVLQREISLLKIKFIPRRKSISTKIIPRPSPHPHFFL